MKNAILIFVFAVVSLTTNATNDPVSIVTDTNIEYLEVDEATFAALKDSLSHEQDLEFRYWNTVYIDLDYFELNSELDQLKHGIFPDKENSWMHNSWVRYANDWENKTRLDKIYVNISTSEIDGDSVTSIQFMSGKLALSQKALEIERELFE